MNLKNAVVAQPQFAQGAQLLGHSNQSSMHHVRSVLSQPKNFALEAGGDGMVQLCQLALGLGAYFDGVGHLTKRGFHCSNLPARSSRRAWRRSRMI